MVYAASDMAPVLDELGPRFATQTGVAVTVNLGATGQLVQQVTAGAPADVFLAASLSALDQLDVEGLLEPGSSQTYARGRSGAGESRRAHTRPGDARRPAA